MADDEVFQDAVEALRVGDKAKARDLLTGLLKTDQNNVTYWVWMSAAMDSAKERVYCLQTALKLDPENTHAKRGLIMHGAMPPDESIKPFPVNRPRAWEQKLLLAHEKPKPKGWAAVRQSPFFRFGLVILLLGGIIAGAIFGYFIPNYNTFQRVATFTPGPSPTFTASPTALGGKPQATSIFRTPSGGAPSINTLLPETFTPTPTYVEIQRNPLTSDYIIQYQNALKGGNYDDAIAALENVIQTDPTATFAYYYLGEVYRSMQRYSNATDAFNRGIQQNPDYGPLYVGLARAQLDGNPNANVLSLLDKAISLDPNFGDAYLERARVKVRDNDITGAIADLSDANKLVPDSPLIFYYLAQARYKEGSFDQALIAAQRAKDLDVTLLGDYLLLGQIYHQLDRDDDAINILTTYLVFQPNDTGTMMFYGRLFFDQGNYDQTIQVMDNVISIENTRQDAYLYRFLSNVEMGNGDAADVDLDNVLKFYPDLFEANLGVLRTHLLKERFGSAEQAVEKTEPLAETDAQKALIYYWAGIVYEKRDNPEKASEYWQLLLDLPTDVVSADVRAEAEDHLKSAVTSTPTKNTTPSATPTKTKTPTPTKPEAATTPSRTPSPTSTPTP